MRLGVHTGDPNQEFSRIRGVARLSDGRIVVADGASQEVRFFAPGGNFEATVGGSGGGPGEFELLWSMVGVDGDSVLAWDYRDRGLTVFGPDGKVARNVEAAGVVGSADFLGRFEDGTWLLRKTVDGVPDRSGIHRASVYYFRVDPDGPTVDTVAVVRGREFEATVGTNPGDPRSSSLEIPFARASVGAIASDRFYVGENDRFEIQVMAPDGQLVSTIRHADGERPITDTEAADLEAAVVEHVDPSPGRRRNIERLFREIQRPPLRPAFSALLVDSDGYLWVGEWVSDFAPPAQRPRSWLVFGSDGQLVADVSMPAGFQPYELGSDYVLGVNFDELDVEFVELYALQR